MVWRSKLSNTLTLYSMENWQTSWLLNFYSNSSLYNVIHAIKKPPKLRASEDKTTVSVNLSLSGWKMSLTSRALDPIYNEVNQISDKLKKGTYLITTNYAIKRIPLLKPVPKKKDQNLADNNSFLIVPFLCSGSLPQVLHRHMSFYFPKMFKINDDLLNH